MSPSYSRIFLAQNIYSLFKRLYERWHIWSEQRERKKYLSEMQARHSHLPEGDEKVKLGETIKALTANPLVLKNAHQQQKPPQ